MKKPYRNPFTKRVYPHQMFWRWLSLVPVLSGFGVPLYLDCALHLPFRWWMALMMPVGVLIGNVILIHKTSAGDIGGSVVEDMYCG